MTPYWLLVCHLVGDYLIQSDWMANCKTKSWWAAIAHAATYTLPFFLLTRAPLALFFIFASHLVIDHFRLARYVCWLKNFLSPSRTVHDDPNVQLEPLVTTWHHPWVDCSGTGYHKDKPAWLVVWLLFIADNTMHLICNGLAWEFMR